jgi:hypothetical protein
MITLKTLHLHTEQQVFDYIVKYLLQQNEKCHKYYHKWGHLCYFKHKNLKSAVGCLISDDEYDPKIEGEDYGQLSAKKKVPVEHVGIIVELESIHDHFPPKMWWVQFKELAKMYGLKFNN